MNISFNIIVMNKLCRNGNYSVFIAVGHGFSIKAPKPVWSIFFSKVKTKFFRVHVHHRFTFVILFSGTPLRLTKGVSDPEHYAGGELCKRGNGKDGQR